MRRLTRRTCLLALSTVLVLVMATSCAPDSVHLRVGVGVGVSPHFYYPRFFYRPYLFDDPYWYDPYWDDPDWHDPWGFDAPLWPYDWRW